MAPAERAGGPGAAAHAAFAYRADIDGLRAVAVLLVLLFHFQLVPWGKAGFIGVDVFFVISGYLITTIVRRQLDAGTFAFGAFYAARVRRLAPGLAAVLLLVLAWGAWRLAPLELAELARQAAAAQLYLSNVYYWRNFNYFGLTSDTVYLLHTWSLAVEEQFYLLYPLLLVALQRWMRRAFWWVLAGAAVASFALNLMLVGPKPMATFYLLPTRAWQLLAGALLAGVALPLASRAASQVLGLASALLLALAVFGWHEGVAVPGWYALAPVAAALGLLVAGAQAQGATARVLSWAPMVEVGRISYVLYLVHWPIHVFAKHEFGARYGLPQRWAMFALSLALAWLICRAFEAPVRERRVLASGRRLVAGYAGIVAGGVALCAALWASGGWPQRLPQEAVRLEAFTTHRSPPLAACGSPAGWRFPPPAECRIGDPKAPVRWLIAGDSHAWAAHGAFDAWLRARGESGWLLYQHQCVPLTGLHLSGDAAGACADFNRRIYEGIEREPGVKAVLLVSTWTQAAEGLLADAPGQGVDNERSLRLFATAFDASVRRIAATGKPLYVWAPVPGAKSAVPPALAQAAWRGGTPDLEFSRQDYERHFAFFFRAVQASRAQIAGVISSADTLCASGRCQVSLDGAPLYFDNAHVSTSSAPFWASVMARSVRD
jgi:peptidoglycan/LPS O-acetylase OafA/YrhL